MIKTYLHYQDGEKFVISVLNCGNVTFHYHGFENKETAYKAVFDAHLDYWVEKHPKAPKSLGKDEIIMFLNQGNWSEIE